MRISDVLRVKGGRVVTVTPESRVDGLLSGLAQQLLDRLGEICVARLFKEGFIPAASSARVRAILDSAARFRDSALVELGLLLLAALMGAMVLSGRLRPAGAISGVMATAGHDP